MILYGTNPITWSNDDDHRIGDHLSLDDCLIDCRDLGFGVIEKGHKMPDDGAAPKARLGEYGLRFAAGWFSTKLRHYQGMVLAALRRMTAEAGLDSHEAA